MGKKRNLSPLVYEMSMRVESFHIWKSRDTAWDYLCQPTSPPIGKRGVETNYPAAYVL